jgi:hypothetical protein
MRYATMNAAAKPAFSELILSDRLITLAKDADRAGFIDTAEHDEAPKKPH